MMFLFFKSDTEYYVPQVPILYFTKTEAKLVSKFRISQQRRNATSPLPTFLIFLWIKIASHFLNLFIFLFTQSHIHDFSAYHIHH